MNVDNLDDFEVELPEEFDRLPVFVVGGAVRDRIMGDNPEDIDLMVAEVTPSEMKSRGFREIDSPNNDTFAVFLDSLDREVAIAREEVSTGTGHGDFSVEPVPETVEAGEAVSRDLKRRDFTINAMAYDVRWNVLHDPHGGVGALEEGIIRHVSEAFRDDPLRIIRGARFAARFGFDVAEETRNEMQLFADEISDLPGERIRLEMEKTFRQAIRPRTFFDVLNEVGALEVALPELHELTTIPAGPEKYHAEGSTYEHTMMVVEQMQELMPNDELALWMALTHDFGKAATPEERLPHHYGHGEEGVPIIEEMADRLALSNKQLTACKEASRHHMRLKNVGTLKTTTLFDSFCQIENRDRFSRLMVADARGKEPPSEFDNTALQGAWQRAMDAITRVSAQDVMDEGHTPESLGGEEFGRLLRQRRVEKMRSLK